MPSNLRQANEAWEALLTTHSATMRRFAAEPVWREHGVIMREYDVLYTLAKCGAPARVGELQQHVVLSQPALSRLVDRLEARGLVARVSDQADGRAVLVELTPTGTELQRAVGRSHARSVEREMRALTIDELRELQRLVTKLNQAPEQSSQNAHKE